jgi:hypothetical protein
MKALRDYEADYDTNLARCVAVRRFLLACKTYAICGDVTAEELTAIEAIECQHQQVASRVQQETKR